MYMHPTLSGMGADKPTRVEAVDNVCYYYYCMP